MSPVIHLEDTLLSTAALSIQRSADALLKQQEAQGHWCAQLTADSTLESDDILLQLWMNPPVNGVWQFRRIAARA